MLAVIVLLAVHADPSAAELVNENVRVQAHDYRYFHTNIASWPATLLGSARVAAGPSVRIELLSQRELLNFIHGRAPSFLLDLSERPNAEFRQALPAKGEYDILLINDANEPSEVRLEAAIQFARQPDVAKYLPPARRLIVILVSLLVFCVAMTWSGFKLIRGMRGSG